MIVLKILFWTSLGAILWTHVAYPLLVAVFSAVRRNSVAKGDQTPSVAIVAAAHNEEGVIARLVESLLPLPIFLVLVVIFMLLPCITKLTEYRLNPL